MLLLLIVSLVWAFSFGLVKRLGGLDPTAIATLRLTLSLAVFLPFLRPKGLGAFQVVRLALIGAVQFGIMYILYQKSYAHLHAYEVALFTITTPLFVTLIDAVFAGAWRTRYAVAALLSVAGAAVLVWHSFGDSAIIGGVLLVQLANLCFAAGQVAWRYERKRLPAKFSDASVFAIPFAAAVLTAFACSLGTTNWAGFTATSQQWLTLIYLGAVASGICFFLWNKGATQVNAGVLAAFNNAKIPLGVAVSILVFREKADLARLLIGGGLMALGVWAANGGRDGKSA
ncbi:MAG TPA: EamA family transporter [Opitutaceae bacterium]|jgi:drug/metabolite transporter (DMT)-like permease|nr:EamA family transporter [Opitutaceae bacterium]